MSDISNEYAVALFTLACENGEEEAVLDALELCRDVLAQNPEYTELLACHNLTLNERLSAIDEAFGASVPLCVLSFIKLLCEKGRIREFFDCVSEYEKLLNFKNSVVCARVVSAIELSESQKNSLKAKLENKSRKTVILECTVDESLIGGITVEMDGTVLDGSLRHRLQEVKDVIDQ